MARLAANQGGRLGVVGAHHDRAFTPGQATSRTWQSGYSHFQVVYTSVSLVVILDVDSHNASMEESKSTG